MTKKLLLSASVALMLAACQGAENSAKDTASKAKDAVSAVAKADLPEGVTLVESVTRKGDEVVIPYDKYKLDNGLTVVLHQDKSDPLVHVDVTYHVGSGREDIGKSGFAHFFEHMLFPRIEKCQRRAALCPYYRIWRHIEWFDQYGPHKLL